MELLESAPARSKKINFKKETGRYLRRWYWLVLGLLLALLAAHIYLRYAEKLYLSKTSLRFQQNKSNGVSASALSDLKGLGMGVSGDDELLTETSVIISKPILSKVVQRLSLRARIFSVGKVKEVEMYKDAPFRVRLLEDSVKNGAGTYTLSPAGGNSFRLSGSKMLYLYGTAYRFPFGTAVISAAPRARITGVYRLQVVPLNAAVGDLESAITVAIPQDKGYIMELSMVGAIPEKSEDILNAVTRQYNTDGLKDKNEEAANTQDFITKRLDIITGDLLGVENQKADFKRQNEIADLQTQAQLSLQNASDNTKQIITYRTQLDLINAVYQEAAGAGDRLIPSNLGLPPSTEALISQYNDLLLTRNSTAKQATSSNPALIELNRDIASLKGIIRKNLSDTRNNLAQSISALQQQVSIDRGKIARVPQQEKTARSIDRELNLKEQLYLYLLQKREENAITLAVTAPKAHVVNPAYTVGQVKPNPRLVYAGAAGLGLMLPLLIMFVAFSVDTRVHSRSDIQDVLPGASIIGEIPEDTDGRTLVGSSDFTVFAESFRILVSNLKFMLKARPHAGGGVVLVTSSIKGEGKTTVSMNTALTLAASSKVLIIGADIRNPQLKRFVTSTTGGLTDFLVADTEDPAFYIAPSGLAPLLDIMHSGPVAPNPNDLLDMPKFAAMLAQLRTRYGYIIIDSAPVMLVSDTMSLLAHADVVLYVAKAGFTEKEMLDIADGFRRDNGVSSLGYVLNGVKAVHSRYGKKYGYGYYADRVQPKGLRKFF